MGKISIKTCIQGGIKMWIETLWMMLVAVAGFIVGRASVYGRQEEEERAERQERQGAGGQERQESDRGDVRRLVGKESEVRSFDGRGSEMRRAERVQAGVRRTGRRGRGHQYVPDRVSWSVASPVSGKVFENKEGEHPTVVIRPDENKVYAPAGGKITKLFPMGNAMIFTTEFGAELFIQAGNGDDELLNRYFRPKIVQNEVVGKGKLLMEFDRQGLEAEGVAPEVSVTVETCAYGDDVRMTAGGRVKAGEEILQVLEAETAEFR